MRSCRGRRVSQGTAKTKTALWRKHLLVMEKTKMAYLWNLFYVWRRRLLVKIGRVEPQQKRSSWHVVNSRRESPNSRPRTSVLAFLRFLQISNASTSPFATRTCKGACFFAFLPIPKGSCVWRRGERVFLRSSIAISIWTVPKHTLTAYQWIRSQQVGRRTQVLTEDRNLLVMCAATSSATQHRLAAWVVHGLPIAYWP